MHIAAAMAEAATGRTWPQIFRDTLGDPLGMSDAAGFMSPSTSNPRPSGGAQGSAEDYERFLLAMLGGELLDGQLGVMHRDWTPADEVTIAYSPASEWGQDWHYGLGNWLECPEATWSAACAAMNVVSSPGAFGFHPWIDRERGIYGILARQDGLLRQPAAGSAELMIQLRPGIYDAMGR
jgi:D-alanyl-D-alanine-carboxypeptidase/D-alanyl-D-alanine-endopeptidase